MMQSRNCHDPAAIAVVDPSRRAVPVFGNCTSLSSGAALQEFAVRCGRTHSVTVPCSGFADSELTRRTHQRRQPVSSPATANNPKASEVGCKSQAGAFAGGMDSEICASAVAPEKSRAEIESVLIRYGATQFGYMMSIDKATIGFEAHNRRIRFVLPLPVADSAMRQIQQHRIEQEIRQRWRALLLAIKAKLEAVETGISTFEDEFLPYTILPNGKTVAEMIQPQIETAYTSGRMPPLLLTDGS